ncbi:DUF636 domain-containing protein [Mycena floridula]|nr:DUF636 domain-containing protein [Mycena floridula]
MAAIRSGSCLCRRIQFKLTAEPFHFLVCHCPNCKKFSGSSFMANVMFKESNVEITAGQNALKRYEDSDTQTGRTITRSFCSNCGSSLFINPSKAIAGNDYTIVMSGCIEGAEEWVPKKEGFVENKCSWIKELALKVKNSVPNPDSGSKL